MDRPRGENEQGEVQKAARQQFDTYCKDYPSFADPFWGSILAQLATKSGDPHAQELQRYIDAAVEKFFARDQAIVGVLMQCRENRSAGRFASDVNSLVKEWALLQAALRDHGLDLEELANAIDQLAHERGLSRARREAIAEHAEALRVPLLVDIQSVPLPDMREEDDWDIDHDEPTVLNDQIPALRAVDVKHDDDEKTSDAERDEATVLAEDLAEEARQEKIAAEVRDREYADAQVIMLRKMVNTWRGLAEREIMKRTELPWLVSILDGHETSLQHLIHDAQNFQAEYPNAHINVLRYRAMRSDVLLMTIAQDIGRITRLSGQENDDYIGTTFIPIAQDILHAQVQCEIYRDHIIRLRKEQRAQGIREVPHKLLHVAPDADRNTIEHAYAAAVQMLDFDSAHDREEIFDLQRARDAMLYPIEVREIREAAARDAGKKAQQLVQEKRLAQKAMHISQTSQQEPPSFFEKVVRGPGGLVRAAFGALVLALGGSVVAHEVQEQKEFARQITGETDDGRGDDGARDGGADEGGSVGMSEERGALEGEGGRGARGEGGEKTEEPVVDAAELSPVKRTVVSGDTMWGIASDMLRARGLKPTDVLNGYFTHVVAEDNKALVPVPEKMQPGTVLDLTRAAQEMNAMVDVPVSSIVEETSSTNAPQTDAGSTFEHDDGVALSSDAGSTIARAGDVEPGSDAVLPDGSRGVPAEYVRETIRVMKKGDRIYTMVYGLLRESKFNWNPARVNVLTQIVLNDNADNFRTMVADGRMRGMKDVWIPVGAEINMTRAMKVIDEMAAARDAGKKVKSVKQIAQEQGIPYPIEVKFPL